MNNDPSLVDAFHLLGKHSILWILYCLMKISL